jgi:PAS domain S-box-containing protein
MLNAFNEKMNFIAWNLECERVTGYSAEEIIGNPHAFERLYPDPEARAHMLETWKLNDNHYHNLEFSLRCKNGQMKIISWSSIFADVLVSDWEICSVGIDVTERKRTAERELQLASERERVRILSDFIQDAAHEFRTPLSIINTSAYLLEHLEDFDARLNHTGKISEQVRNITTLVENLLTLSRLDTDTNIHLRRMNLNDLMTNAQVALEIPIREKHHFVRLELDNSLPKIVGDSQKLHLALVNILYNAVRYTPPKGTITLRTYKNETNIVAEIQDTGVGIKPG